MPSETENPARDRVTSELKADPGEGEHRTQVPHETTTVADIEKETKERRQNLIHNANLSHRARSSARRADDLALHSSLPAAASVCPRLFLSLAT